MRRRTVKDLWVVEWSQSQQSFHIQRMSEAVTANSRRFWQRPLDMFDWVPVYVGTRRQCEIIVAQSERRVEREQEANRWIH